MIRLSVFLGLALAATAALSQPMGEGWRARPRDSMEAAPRDDQRERERAWRRMPPEERSAMRERMSPEEREQMRNRFVERHQQHQQRMSDCCSAPGPDGQQPRRLSPEERRQLREQIREANREMPHHGRRDRP